jgi:hypothetical protein
MVKSTTTRCYGAYCALKTKQICLFVIYSYVRTRNELYCNAFGDYALAADAVVREGNKWLSTCDCIAVD